MDRQVLIVLVSHLDSQFRSDWENSLISGATGLSITGPAGATGAAGAGVSNGSPSAYSLGIASGFAVQIGLGKFFNQWSNWSINNWTRRSNWSRRSWCIKWIAKCL